MPPSRRESRPCVGISLTDVPPSTLEGRIDRAAELGFRGVEVPLTGEAGAGWPHAPTLGPDERAFLKESLSRFASVALEAPYQGTFDVTLVSPSSAIRRASLSELWSVCRVAEAVGAQTVLVRTGLPPRGLAEARAGALLGESLTTLDRMARDHGCRVALLNADLLARLVAFGFLETAVFASVGIALDVAAARVGGEPDAAIARFAEVHADFLLHRRVPASDDPLAYAGDDGSSGMICLAFPDFATDGPAAVAARRAEWERGLVRG